MKRPVMGWLQSPQRAVERVLFGDGAGAGDQWLRRWGVVPGVGRGRVEGLVGEGDFDEGPDGESSGVTMTGMLMLGDGLGSSSGKTMVGTDGWVVRLVGSDTAMLGMGGGAARLLGSDTAILGTDGGAGRLFGSDTAILGIDG